MKSKNNFVAFTVCNIAYLHKALVLADSFFKITKSLLKIYIIDTKRDLGVISGHHKIIWVEELNIPDFNNLAFKYDITELSTSLKPYLAKLNLENNDKVIFFDPDIYIFFKINSILEDLDECSILLTPHYTKPEPDHWENSDIGMMRFGSFNLGFFGVRSTSQSHEFLDWWHNRCMRFCFFETQFGLSTDQKWLSIAPCFYSNIKISFNLGYNMAFWNLHERCLYKDKNGNLMVNNKDPLIFFHFSSFDENQTSNLSTRPIIDKKNINDILKCISMEYGESQLSYKSKIENFKYGYDYMSDGKYISPTLRRAYASILPELDKDHDPFSVNGAVAKFAAKNGLFERKNINYRTYGYADKENHSLKFSFIYILFRMILKITGPNNFHNFSRLLVYLSSYRQNRDLWKI